MSIEYDPPAAHSMDTMWFAIDADGVVARFDSGEAGAVPNEAAWAGGPAEQSFDVELLEQWLIARRLIRDASAFPAEDDAPLPARDRVVVILAAARPRGDEPSTYRDGSDSSHPAEARFAAYDPIVLHASSPRVIGTRRTVPRAMLKALRRDTGVVRLVTLVDATQAHCRADPKARAERASSRT